jgi:DMSO/TMAO reductase YedYZ molybdopterin-dependent catalytic subunit
MESNDSKPRTPRADNPQARPVEPNEPELKEDGAKEPTAPAPSEASAASESTASQKDESKRAKSKEEESTNNEPAERDTKASIPRLTQREFGRMSRRELLPLAPLIALGAFAIPGWQQSLLKKGLSFSDWASARLFRRAHLAPTFADSDLTPFEKFPINGYDVDDPGVIFENWTLTVGGLVQKPGDYRLAQIQALPRARQNTRHVCVEGWDVIGRFGGARLSDFLSMIGADTTARFITVNCADDYYESLDMATALHPQTLLCYEMYDRPLTREHGAPLRLNIPTKVGYKQAKYLTDLKVTNVLGGKVGYWEDQGYSSFYGL